MKYILMVVLTVSGFVFGVMWERTASHQELEPHYKKLVERIYKEGGDNE